MKSKQRWAASMFNSIKAASVGAAGKGFAVVAEEVRNFTGKITEVPETTLQFIEHPFKWFRAAYR